MRYLYLALMMTLVSCSGLQKMAIRSSSSMFQRSSDGLMKEGNWDFFRQSAPGNIKFLELLWEQDQENMVLLSVLIKGYAGYAFAVPETLAFGDELAGIEDSPSKKEAIFFYTRALDYGLLYLKKKEIAVDDLLRGDEAKLSQQLKKIGKDDIIALLYTAQAWGSLINLQKDNIALVAQIPKVKILFDRVCKLDSEIDQNVCDIFYAQYDASRPKMLGGDPANAEKLYQEAILRHPKHLLIRLSYIQYLLLPGFEQEKYEKEADALKTEFAVWEDQNRDDLENKSPYRKVKSLNLYNAIAKKRFEFVEKYKSKFF